MPNEQLLLDKSIGELKTPGRFDEVIEKLTTVAREQGVAIYAVGGFVRDLYSGAKEPKDLDILVDTRDPEGARKFAQALKKKYNLADEIPHPNKFFTCKIKIDNEMIDIAIPRTERYNSKSNDPEEVNVARIEDDAKRRDFSMNALYYNLNTGEILDPTGHGKKDIKDKVIRFTDLANPDTILQDDPIRMLRAIVFNKKLGYAIDPQVEKAITRNAKWFSDKNIEKIDEDGNKSFPMGEAIKNELEKLLREDKPGEAFRKIHQLGLLGAIIPELAATDIEHNNPSHPEKVLEHILMVLDNIGKDEEIALKWAALFHDIGKAHPEVLNDKRNEIVNGVRHFLNHEGIGAGMVQDILTRFGLPKDIKNRVEKLVNHHMDRHTFFGNTKQGVKIKDEKVLNFINDIGEYMDDLIKLIRADVTGRKISDIEKENELASLEVLTDRMKEMNPVYSFIKSHPVYNSKEVIDIVNDYYENPKIGKAKRERPQAGNWIKRLLEALTREHFKHPEWMKPVMQKDNINEIDENATAVKIEKDKAEARNFIRSLAGNKEFMGISKKAWLGSIGYLQNDYEENITMDKQSWLSVSIKANIDDNIDSLVNQLSETSEYSRYKNNRSYLAEVVYKIANAYDPTEKEGSYVRWIISQIKNSSIRVSENFLDPNPSYVLKYFQKVKEIKNSGKLGDLSSKIDTDINKYNYSQLVNYMRFLGGETERLKTRELVKPDGKVENIKVIAPSMLWYNLSEQVKGKSPTDIVKKEDIKNSETITTHDKILKKEREAIQKILNEEGWQGFATKESIEQKTKERNKDLSQRMVQINEEQRNKLLSLPKKEYDEEIQRLYIKYIAKVAEANGFIYEYDKHKDLIEMLTGQYDPLTQEVGKVDVSKIKDALSSKLSSPEALEWLYNNHVERYVPFEVDSLLLNNENTPQSVKESISSKQKELVDIKTKKEKEETVLSKEQEVARAYKRAMNFPASTGLWTNLWNMIKDDESLVAKYWKAFVEQKYVPEDIKNTVKKLKEEKPILLSGSIKTSWLKKASGIETPSSVENRFTADELGEYFHDYPNNSGVQMDKQLYPKQDTLTVNVPTDKSLTAPANGSDRLCPNCAITMVVEKDNKHKHHCTYCGHTENDAPPTYYNPDGGADKSTNPAMAFGLPKRDKIEGNPDAIVTTFNSLDSEY